MRRMRPLLILTFAVVGWAWSFMPDRGDRLAPENKAAKVALQLGSASRDPQPGQSGRALVSFCLKNSGPRVVQLPLIRFWGKGSLDKEDESEIYSNSELLPYYAGLAVATIDYRFRGPDGAVETSGQTYVTSPETLVLQPGEERWMVASVALPKSGGSFLLQVTLDNRRVEEAVLSHNARELQAPIFGQLIGEATLLIPKPSIP